MTETKIKQEHYNLPQIKFGLVMAQTNILLWGRRTGKTLGPLALFILTNVLKMPRSNGFIYAATYEQMLTRTLPPLMAGWAKLGYVEGVHYWMRRWPPKHLNLPDPFLKPLKPDYFISWFNGSGIYLVSQDVPSSINGVASQYGAGDEAKQFKVDKLREEAMLTFSGGEQYRDLSNYMSTCFTSDMPSDRSGNWLFEFEALMDQEVIDKIIVLQEAYNYKLNDVLVKDYTQATLKVKYFELQKLDSYLNELRKGTVYYNEASTLDNIHVLGMEPIRAFARELEDADFNRTVLNRRHRGSQRSFYAALDMNKHGYDKPNNAYIDSLPDVLRGRNKKDCRWTDDILHHKPLDMGIDINAAIKCCVVDQYNEHINTYRRLSSHYVLHPKQMEHLADEFDEYYKYHPTKEVNFPYDHTMVAEIGSNGTSYADDWISALEKRGWIVNSYYIGQQPSFKSRYKLWNKMLLRRDNELPVFKYNKTNADSWYVSACETGAIDKEDKIEKDKRPEKDKKYPQQEAPHLSDAGDTVLWWNLSNNEQKESIFMDIM